MTKEQGARAKEQGARAKEERRSTAHYAHFFGVRGGGSVLPHPAPARRFRFEWKRVSEECAEM